MNQKSLYLKLLFTLLLAGWFIGIFFHIIFPDYSAAILPGIIIDRSYSIVCHQEAAKTFFIRGQNLEVCARCTGIYAGGAVFAVIALLIPSLKPGSVKTLFLAMIPMALDVLLYSAGIYDYSNG